MRRANDVTIEAYRAAFKTMRAGMTQGTSPPTSPPPSVRSASTGRPACRSASGPRCRTAASRRSGSRKATSSWWTAARATRVTRRTSRAPRSSARPASGRPTCGTRAGGPDGGVQGDEAGRDVRSVDAAARAVIVKAGFGPAYKSGPAAPHRPRHRPRRPRVDELREGQQDAARAGHVLQRRADDRDSRRVRHPPRGLRLLDDNGAHFFTKQSIAIDQPFG